MSYPILALDCATRLGWAYTIRPAGKVHSGVRNCPGGNPGAVLASFEAILQTLISDSRPAVIYIEQPIATRLGAPSIILWGMAAIVRKEAHKRSALFRDATPSAIKKHWTGYGKSDKAHMVEEAKLRGYRPKDDNEADALALLHLALETEDPERAAAFQLKRMAATGAATTEGRE